MRSFFSQNVSDYVTPVSSDSLSPFPTEYDATNEKEMKFLTLSSLDTRGDPQYEDVFNHLKLSFPPFIVTFFAPITWIFDHRPLCWVRSFVKDLILATRVSVVLRPIASNEEVLRNPHIAKEIDRLSSPDTPNAEPRESVLKRARKIIDRMATRQRDWVLRIFYILLSFLFRALFRSVHIDRNGLTKFHEKWEKLEKGVGVMFLPTHKSHIDYLVLSYVSAIYDLPLPVIAAGDNLNFPIIGALFQHSGAFFMRRSLGDDTLYRAILEGYLEEVLKSGSTLEFFIEGGRSRDGTILPPKYGLLNVVLDAVKAGRLNDVCIVPISVDYEHCPDIGSYVKYMMGGKKKKESLMGLLKNAHSILSMSCGDAFVTLGSPLSLQELLKRMEQEDATLDVRHEVKYVGAHVCRAMRNNSVMTTSCLASAALMEFPAGEWVSEAEVAVCIDHIRSWLHAVGAFEGYSSWSLSILHQFMRSFPDLVECQDKKVRAKTGAKERIELFYCRNQCIHYFLADAVVLHVFAVLREQAPTRTVSLVDLVPVVDLACRIISTHIPFNHVQSAPAIEALVERGLLVVNDDMVSLGQCEQAYLHFCMSLVAPLIDNVWVVSDAIQNLGPDAAQHEVDLNVLIVKCMEMIHALEKEGKMYYTFVENTQMVRNNIEGLVSACVLKKRKEGSAYLISLEESYNETAKLMALHESLGSLRKDMNKVRLAEEESSEVAVTDDVIGLMMDVKK